MEAYRSLTGLLRCRQWRARNAGSASTAWRNLVTNCDGPRRSILRDDIYELRTKYAGVNYRMLYFFHGRTAAVVSHGIMKQQAEVPPKEIEKAVQRKALFEAHPQRHTFIPPED